MRAVCLRGKHKLADNWESDIHVVVSQAGDLPVYTIRPENKDGPLQTVHRDLLLPCGFLPPIQGKPLSPEPARKSRTKQSKEPEDVSGYSDAEDDIPWFQEQPAREVIRFTTVFEILKTRRDSDLTFQRTSQTHSTKDTHLPVENPESDIHLPVGDTDSDTNLPIDRYLLMTKMPRTPHQMLLQWARETLPLMVERVKRTYMMIPQTVERRTL